MAELETIEPAPPTLLFARTRLPPVVTPTDAKRDPCNAPAVYLPSHDPANLWPRCVDRRTARACFAVLKVRPVVRRPAVPDAGAPSEQTIRMLW